MVPGRWSDRVLAATTIMLIPYYLKQIKEVKLECLRQQLKKAVGQPNFSLADFIKPVQNRGQGSDYMGHLQSPFMRFKLGAKNLLMRNDEYIKILVQNTGDRFVEAFAECLHEKSGRRLGICKR
jgi:5-methyltetrahydrofolate--homocysteine methyltransferase